MSTHLRLSTDHRRHRTALTFLAAFTLLATALSLVAEPAPVGAEEIERHLPVVAADDTGYEALVNTLGLRSARSEFAGEYVTIAERTDKNVIRPRLQTENPANQLFTEFGVFREEHDRFKLLGSNGKWVRIRWNANATKYQAGTWAKTWDAAWAFELVRPKPENLGPLEDELGGSGIEPEATVCVRVFSAKGNHRGLLAVTRSGVMVLSEKAACGKRTSTLFITDSLARGERPRTVVDGVDLDPLTFVRFVAPDYRADPPLTEDQRDIVRGQIADYFDDLLDFNQFLKIEIRSTIDEVADALSMETYLLPGGEKTDLNIVGMIVEHVQLGLSVIPVVGALAGGAVKASYNYAMLGVNIAHNADLDGPRYVESLSNDVLRTKNQLRRDYTSLFGQVAQNLEALETQLLADCPPDRFCRSDRKLAMWRLVRPDADLDTTELTMQRYVAGHEVTVWRRLLPLRGVLEQPYQEHNWDWFYMWGWQDGSCETEHEQPFTHWTFLQGAYIPWVEEHAIENTIPGTLANRLLVTSTAWRPFEADHCWDAGDVQWVEKAYSQGWTLAVLQDGEGVPPLILDDNDLRRLFDVWNPNDPYYDASGLGLSVREVACVWLDNDATSAYAAIQEHDRYFNPCHFAFANAAGVIVSPFDAEAPYTAAEGMNFVGLPYTEAVFTPDAAELAAGRSLTDPDVVAPFVPRLVYRSCDAWEGGDVVSVSGGDPVTAYATNLYDGPITLYPLDADGRRDQANPVIMIRQDHLDPTYVMAYAGQLPLTHTEIPGATVGAAYVAVNAGGDCLGTWTVTEMPSNPVVHYQVAEIHGDDGILDHAGLTP